MTTNVSYLMGSDEIKCLTVTRMVKYWNWDKKYLKMTPHIYWSLKWKNRDFLHVITWIPVTLSSPGFWTHWSVYKYTKKNYSLLSKAYSLDTPQAATAEESTPGKWNNASQKCSMYYIDWDYHLVFLAALWIKGSDFAFQLLIKIKECDIILF